MAKHAATLYSGCIFLAKLFDMVDTTGTAFLKTKYSSINPQSDSFSISGSYNNNIPINGVWYLTPYHAARGLTSVFY